MKKLSIKTNSIATSLILIALLMTSLALFSSPVNAQSEPTQPVTGALPQGITPDATANVRAFLSFRPNPVGVGQTILINMWTSVAPGAGRMHRDYTLTITKPDGVQVVEKFDTYPNDGTAWFEYVVDQPGEWKIKFDFLGTYFPAGYYVNGEIVNATTGGTRYTESAYYPPYSTEEQVLTVQEEQVYSWPPAPLPTDYWTRPVSMMNREWWPILGNYPWPYGNERHDYAGPYVIAPNTAHIAWKQQGGLYGLIGGELGGMSNYQGGIGGVAAGSPTVIYEGRGYQTFDKPSVGPVAQCYNIRTGEIFYEIPIAQGGVTPTILSYPPVSSLGTLTPELLTISSNRLIKINPWTGLVTLNVTAMNGVFYNGAYVLSLQNTGSGYQLINWTTVGTSSNFASRIMSNISFPWSSISLYDFNTAIGFSVTGISEGGAFAKQRVMAASLVSGSQLWNITIDEPNYSGSCNVADNGKIAILSANGYFVAYDQQTGSLAWKGEQMDYPWDAPAFGAYDIGSAYGMIYRSAYSGMYAFNWDDGKIAWKFEAPAVAYETPYVNTNGTGVYSWNGGMLIADGKIYNYNAEHSPTMPITRGWRLFCLNATTGTGIWNITGFSASRNFQGGAADGYLAFDNFYDGFLYVFGKGKSAITVFAPQTEIAAGTKAMITGTVLDQSPAQPGTPCVSKESMTAWMEYLHMQTQVPMDVIGVPVSIDAVDPNGNSIHIATVTTDMSGTFGYAWTPEITGEYKITATFAGDDSYGSSWAQTYATVTETSEAPVTPTAISFDAINSTVTTTVIGGVIAIIIAIVLVGLLILRKRP